MFWLVHVADLGRPPRISIDYLLRAVSRWQRVLSHCLPPIFHSLLTTDTINCNMSLVYEGYSVWDGSLGNMMIVTKHFSLTDGDAAHPCAVQGSLCTMTGPMRDDDTLNVDVISLFFAGLCCRPGTTCEKIYWLFVEGHLTLVTGLYRPIL